MSTKKKTSAAVVAVLNMKGGVGKTTVSAHVFRVLFESQRKKILLLDLDPQFNLTQTLFTRTDYEQWKAQGKTIMAVMERQGSAGLFEVNEKQAPLPAPATIARSFWHMTDDSNIDLSVVPGDFELVKYSLMNDNEQLSAIKRRFLRFVSEARSSYDLICIDCNPSSSFFTLCALEASTHLLVPVRPDRYSVLGLELLSDYVADVPSIDPKPQTIILLNGVPTSGYDTAVEDTLRAHPKFGPQTLAAKLYTSKILGATSDYTGFATDKPVPHRTTLHTRISAIVDELVPALGLN